MGATFSRAAADQLDGKTIEEREVIGNIIRTDIEEEHVMAEQVTDTEGEQAVAEQAIPRQPDGSGAVEDSSEVPSPTTPDRHNDIDAAGVQDPSMVLSEAAKKAFMCYQRSAAEAAAHPSTAEPAAEQATPLQEDGHKGQNMDEKAVDDKAEAAAPPSLGNSHRSRKRQMKQAASLGVHPPSQSASQQSTPGKRRRREYEKLLEYTQAISGDALRPRSSAGKRQKVSQEATPAKDAKKTPAKPQPTPQRKSVGWMYMGPDLTEADVNQEDWVKCPDGRSYPRSMTYKEGDLLIDEYLNKTDEDQLYVVEAIVDERRRGKKREFRVKWEGFEMNPAEWIPFSNVKDNVELDKWESKLGGDAQ